MAIKKFRLTDEAENYVELQVDTDVLTPELATEINKFWGNAESRMNSQQGDVIAVVVRLFGSLALSYFQQEGGVMLATPIQEAEARTWTNRVIDFAGEGWTSNSFELGIQIVDALVIPLQFESVRLEEIASWRGCER